MEPAAVKVEPGSGPLKEKEEEPKQEPDAPVVDDVNNGGPGLNLGQFFVGFHATLNLVNTPFLLTSYD